MFNKLFKKENTEPSINTETLNFNVTGMTCGHCVAKVEKIVQSIDGVVSVKASHVDNTATIEVESGKVSKEIITEMINASGSYQVIS